MALNSARQKQLTLAIAKGLSWQEIMALAERLKLRPKTATDPQDSQGLAKAIVEEAQRRGHHNTLIKALVRGFPDQGEFAQLLVRDARFSGETSPGVGTAPIQAALHMRHALGAWKPTHILALESELMAFSTLLGPGAKLIHPRQIPVDHSQILSSLKASPGKQIRLLLVAAGEASMCRARSISGVVHESEGLQTRIVQGVRFQDPAHA